MDTRTKPPVTREAALRIALAARALDGLDVKALVGALLEKRGGKSGDWLAQHP